MKIIIFLALVSLLYCYEINERSLSLYCRKYGDCNKYFQVPTADEELLSDSNAGVDSASLWDRYRSELIRFLKKGTVGNTQNFKSLQMVEHPVEIDKNGIPTLLEFSPKWGYTYSPFDYSAGRFTANYKDFLNDLNLPPMDYSTEKQLEPIYDKIGVTQEKMFEEEMKCIQLWESTPPPLQARYGNFENYKSQRCYQINRLDQENKMLNGQVEYIVRGSTDRKTYLGQSAFNKFGMYGNNPRWVELNSYNGFIDAMRQGQKKAFSIDISEKTSYSEESYYSKKSGFNLIIISYNSMKKETKLKTSMSEFKLTISGQGWTGIRVIPSTSWFTFDVIPEWKYGPFRSGAKWFGPEGRMSLIPHVFYFIYQPKVVMFVNKEDAEQIEKQSQTSFGLNLSFLGLNFSKSSTFKKTAETNNLFKIEVESKSPIPQLIAVEHFYN